MDTPPDPSSDDAVYDVYFRRIKNDHPPMTLTRAPGGGYRWDERCLTLFHKDDLAKLEPYLKKAKKAGWSVEQLMGRL